MLTLTSKDNAQIKNVIKLQKSAAHRRRSGLFVAEGLRVCEDAMRSGASGALTKDAAVESILDAIRTVAAGGRVVPDSLMANMRENLASARLTTRQLEILDSVRRGLSNQDIARQLGITVTGVKKHMQAIFAKLGVSSRAEAVGVAMHRQLLKF